MWCVRNIYGTSDGENSSLDSKLKCIGDGVGERGVGERGGREGKGRSAMDLILMYHFFIDMRPQRERERILGNDVP